MVQPSAGGFGGGGEAQPSAGGAGGLVQLSSGPSANVIRVSRKSLL